MGGQSPEGDLPPVLNRRQWAYHILKGGMPMNGPPCRSVFQAPLTIQRYTQVWIKLINQMERTRTAAGLGFEPKRGSLI